MNTFDEEWKAYFRGRDVATINIKDMARHFAKWQKERTIDKACKWLKKNTLKYIDEETYEFYEDDFINDIKKAIENYDTGKESEGWQPTRGC